MTDLGAPGSPTASSRKSSAVARGRRHSRSSATHMIVNVSGEPYLGLEQEALAMMKRD
jgi:hypothetical protein